MSDCYKIVFLGEPGAGKTTCIGALSEFAPVTTDVPCTDALAALKPTTTVALDYGEMRLGDGHRLLLYGLPGQARFRFMFEVVREGLLGAVVLVDAASAEAERHLAETLHTYAGALRELPCVVALNKRRDADAELVRRCLAQLRECGLVAPVVTVDARRREDVARLFELLLVQLDYGTAPQRLLEFPQ